MTGRRKMGLTRTILILILMLGATLYALRLPTQLVPASSEDPQLLKQLLSAYPFPVSVSPSGKRALLKSRRADDFELTVTDILSGNTIAQSISHETQLALAWRPDEEEIAFVSPLDKAFQLSIWNLSSNKVRTFPNIAVGNASLPLRWSPDGRSLLVVVGGSFNGELVLVQNLNEEPTVKQFGVFPFFGDLVWSARGDRFAFVSGRSLGDIEIVSMSSLEKQKVTLSAGGLIRGLAWSPNTDAMLFSVREAGQENYSINVFSFVDQNASVVVRDNSDNRHPLWYVGDHEFVYESVQAGLSTIKRTSLEDPLNSKPLVSVGINQKISHLATDRSKLYFEVMYSDSPATIAALDTKSGNLESDLTKVPPAPIRRMRLDPQQLSLTSFDNQRIPTLLWKPSHTPAHKGIIVIHGGPHLQELPIWEMRTQLLVDNGFVVITPNYRGSTGYGNKYEASRDIGEEALDVIAAARYLKDEMQITAENTVVFAASHGTTILLEAMKKSPHFFSRALVQAFLAPNGFSCPGADFTGSLDLFHGTRDAISPLGEAQRYFEECLKGHGNHSLNIIEGEGHSFQRTRSWERMFRKIIS